MVVSPFSLPAGKSDSNLTHHGACMGFVLLALTTQWLNNLGASKRGRSRPWVRTMIVGHASLRQVAAKGKVQWLT